MKIVLVNRFLPLDLRALVIERKPSNECSSVASKRGGRIQICG